jgi:hypothetical protein
MRNKGKQYIIPLESKISWRTSNLSRVERLWVSLFIHLLLTRLDPNAGNQRKCATKR